MLKQITYIDNFFFLNKQTIVLKLLQSSHQTGKEHAPLDHSKFSDNCLSQELENYFIHMLRQASVIETHKVKKNKKSTFLDDKDFECKPFV